MENSLRLVMQVVLFRPLMEHLGRKSGEIPKLTSVGIMGMSVSSNGKQLASVGQDGQLALWDFADGQPQHRTEIASGWVEHVAWSKSGDHLAVSSGRVVTILSSSGEKIWSSENHPSTVSALEWVTDQELSTACYGRVTFLIHRQVRRMNVLNGRGL